MLPVTFRMISLESFGEKARVVAIGTLVDVKGYTCWASSKTAHHQLTKEFQMSDNVRYIIAAISAFLIVVVVIRCITAQKDVSEDE